MKTTPKKPTINITEAEKLLAETHNLPVKRMDNQLLISFPKEKPKPIKIGKFVAYSCEPNGKNTAKIQLRKKTSDGHITWVKDMETAEKIMNAINEIINTKQS